MVGPLFFLPPPPPALVSSTWSCWLVGPAPMGRIKESCFLTPGASCPQSRAVLEHGGSVPLVPQPHSSPQHLRHTVPHGTGIVSEWPPPLLCLRVSCQAPLVPRSHPSPGHDGIVCSFHLFPIESLLIAQDVLTLGTLVFALCKAPPADRWIQPPLRLPGKPNLLPSVEWFGFSSPRFPASRLQTGSPLALPLLIT